jgi:hypothetical protein
MAFIFEIPSIRDAVSGNDLSLTIGGVRSYVNISAKVLNISVEKCPVF